jgi:hypothetical protein
LESYNVPVVANQILGSFTQNKGGWNIGAGVSFRVKEDSHAKIFALSGFADNPQRAAVGFDGPARPLPGSCEFLSEVPAMSPAGIAA